MDAIDRANQEVEMLLASQLWESQRAYVRLVPRGLCWFCDEPAERLFCNKECAEDYELEQASLLRAGRRED